MIEAKRFPHGCVATPHHLASSAGSAVLAAGGTAVDAAVAANLALGVLTPYLCGFGGDLFAIVATRDGISAYNGSGRASEAATVEAVRSAVAAGTMPRTGALTVTVPGAVEAWFVLLDRFGSRAFGDLAGAALAYAREGFPLSARGADSIQASRAVFDRFAGWQSVYGRAPEEGFLRQADLARTIETLASDGAEAFYRGPIGADIAREVQRLGGLLTEQDLARHRGEWVRPMRAAYRGVEILELPPNTQGVTVLEALRIIEAIGSLPPDGPDRHHLLIEATKLALADRDAYVTDAERMTVDPAALLAPAHIDGRRRAFDPSAATTPEPGRPAPGGTAYLCAADREGTVVSLIQSNWRGFGSGITVPGWGINLQNRGSYFSLDAGHVNVVAPGKRTMHTLIPGMALRDGRPWLAFGSMGGDGQAQTHVQLLSRILDDGEDIQRSIDAPRWVISPADWSVAAESRFGAPWFEELRRRGHRVEAAGPYDGVMGHAHAIAVEPHGYAGATDPRTEGAVAGG